MNFAKKAVLGLLVVGLGACTVMPNGPSVMVLPGSGRSLESFNSDDAYCRSYAYQQIGGKTAEESAKQSTVNSAAVGTVVGAVAGALIGGGGRGAAVGAGAGLAMGTAVGSDRAQASGYGSQRRYDNAYVQCMYSKGHRVPVAANMTSGGNVANSAPPQRDPNIPPPPAGQPPAPPPDLR
jgi:hypothetical protein